MIEALFEIVIVTIEASICWVLLMPRLKKSLARDKNAG
jgi:hypothetical protein